MNTFPRISLVFALTGGLLLAQLACPIASFGATKSKTAVTKSTPSTLKPLSPNASGTPYVPSPASQNIPGYQQWLTTLTKLEQQLFSTEYPQEELQSRLERLEKTVYGQVSSSQPPNERIQKLEATIAQNFEAPKPAQTNTEDQPTWIPAEQGSPAATNQPVNSSPSQPALDKTPAQSVTQPAQTAKNTPAQTPTKTLGELESYLFNRTYPKETMPRRVMRLENEVFKAPQKGTISSRITRMQTVVLGKDGTAQVTPIASQTPDPNSAYNPYNQGQNTAPAPNQFYLPPEAQTQQPPSSTMAYNPYLPPGYNPNQAPPPQYAPNTGAYPNMPNPQTYQDPDVQAQSQDKQAALTQLEREVLKVSYPAEPVNSRLDRLESKVFRSTSPEMSDNERLDRLMAVVAADGNNPKPQNRGGGGIAPFLPFLLLLPLMLL